MFEITVIVNAQKLYFQAIIQIKIGIKYTKNHISCTGFTVIKKALQVGYYGVSSGNKSEGNISEQDEKVKSAE